MPSENEGHQQESESRELFGYSEDEEISDLEGDQAGSDAEQGLGEEENKEPQGRTSDTEQNESDLPDLPVLSNLPSFKKRTRDVTEEESAQLEATRREILQQKQGIERSNKEDLDEDGVQLTPEEAQRRENDRIIAMTLAKSTKKRKQNRPNEEDLERSMDEELIDLRSRMTTAAEKDLEANDNQQPALEKLRLLEEVTKILSRKTLCDSILDNQLLDAVRFWLEPLPDRSLPNLDIQNNMLDILDKLPIASDHLRESGVGKIVNFYTRSPRISMSIKRKAEQLMAKWCRGLIKRKDYHDQRPASQEYGQEVVHSKKRQRRDDYEDEKDPNGPTSTHVTIPRPVDADYSIMPMSTISADKIRKSKHEGRYKRLQGKMRSISTGSKRS